MSEKRNAYLDTQNFEPLRSKFHSLSAIEKRQWLAAAYEFLKVQPGSPKTVINAAYIKLRDEANKRVGDFALLSNEEWTKKASTLVNYHAILTDPLFSEEGNPNKPIDERMRSVILDSFKHSLDVYGTSWTSLNALLTKMMEAVRFRRISLEDVEQFVQENLKNSGLESINELMQKFDLKTRF